MTSISGNMGGAIALDLAAASLGAEVGALSGAINIAVGMMANGAFQPSGPAFTASMTSSSQATVDLGDGNTLLFDKSNSQIQIEDAQGDVTTIYGDPHLLENGQQVGTFYGTTTFQLQDGTNITLNTKPGQEGTGVTYADQVTITRGANAVVIGNLDQQTGGALTLSSSQNGYALSAATSEGLVLEQASGGNWISSLTGQDVTQNDLNMTKPAGEAAIQFGQELGQMLGAFLSMGVMSAGLSALVRGGGTEASGALPAGHHPHSPLAALGLGLDLQASVML